MAADPSAGRARERRQRYRGFCPSCGASTGPAGDGDGRLCRRCVKTHWGREEIVKVLRAARDELGRIPTSTDFHRGEAIRRGGQALRLYQRYGFNSSTVIRVFGSWTAAKAAAFSQDFEAALGSAQEARLDESKAERGSVSQGE